YPTITASGPEIISGSFTLDAVLKKTISGSFTLDAITKKTVSASFAFDALISRTILTDTFTRTTSGDLGTSDNGVTYLTLPSNGTNTVESGTAKFVGVAGGGTQAAFTGFPLPRFGSVTFDLQFANNVNGWTLVIG